MNKKLLAIAITSALTAPMIAQAEEGNVTLYGSTNLAVETIKNGGVPGAAGTGTSTAVNSNQSVLGVQGNEPLGNGLKAVFHFDALLGLDGSTSTLLTGGRDGWAGLAGGFGTVALGFQGRPWKTSTNNLDPFGSTIADYSSVVGTISSGQTLFDTGCGSALIYFAPNWSGFSGHAQYCSKGAHSVSSGLTGTTSDQWGVQVNYSNGPLYATYSHDDLEHADQTALTPAGNVPSIRADKVGVSYTFFGALTTSFIFDNLSSDGAASRADRKDYWGAVSYKFGNNAVKAAYSRVDASKEGGDGANYYAVGISHYLSKRTELYGLYTRIHNDSNAAFGVGGSIGILTSTGATGGITDFGQSPSAFAFGIKHNF